MKKKEYLSGQNFARLSNIFYAGNVTVQEFNLLNKNNIKVINQDNYLTTYKQKILKLKNGDIIFCSSGYLGILFHYLNKLKKIDNITLITGQSDIPINKTLFNKKPLVVKKWYSTNIDYENDLLKAIPLGLANDYSPKNTRIDDFLNFNKVGIEKVNKLYINLQKNTNPKERNNLEKFFINKDWVVTKEPYLEINDYLQDLHKYKFILCPWGNGYDTHRLWETIYSGSIPVTKKHRAYKEFSDFPIILVDKYEQITLEFLLNESKEFTNRFIQAKNINFWKQEIVTSAFNKETYQEEINEDKLYEFYYWKKLKVISYFKNKWKIIKYYSSKLKKILSF